MSPTPLRLALGAAAAVAAVTAVTVRLSAAVPPLQADVHAPTTLTVPGIAPDPVSLPAGGSLVLEAVGGVSASPDRLAALAPDSVRPIGSVAKTMTALTVLEAHPLAPGEPGPLLTMTEDDVALYRAALAVDGSSLRVRAGERLSERELLLGLMLPSANNLAETLGRWVSGSHAAFVDRLNRRAAELGMSSTHFDDPSGFSPATRSTAADLVRLGRAALGIPALAAIVATPQATLSDGTALTNLDALLGTLPGWLGIKTGETPQAGGCLLFAARRTIGDAAAPVTLVGAVLGQRGLAGALDAARSAVESGYAGYGAVRLGELDPRLTGTVRAPWGDTAGLLLAPGDGDPVALRPGAAMTLATVPARLTDRIDAGGTVGRLEARSGGAVLARWRVTAAAPLGPAPLLWRLFERR